MSLKYLQYGCGLSGQDGWINYDGSPTLWFERLPVLGRLYTRNEQRFDPQVRFGNVVRGLPVQDESCVGVYCSHVLEHLSYDGCVRAIQETYRMLAPDGRFRLVMPDLEFYCRAYVESNDSSAALHFMRDTMLGQEYSYGSLKRLIIDAIGNSKHLWLWDYKSIEKVLKDVGFRQIRRAYFNDSEDEKFCEIEIPERWSDCLGVECVK